MDISLYKDEIERIIKNASKIFYSDIRKHVEEKRRYDLVTDADKTVQRMICEELYNLAPEVYFMGEEEGKSKYIPDKPLWILDPIDGTTNLICDIEKSAVSLAFCDRGIVKAGFVYDPYLDEMFYAEKGKGAFLNGKPIHVSNESDISRALIVIGTAPYEREMKDRTMSLISNLMDSCLDIRRLGAASLDLCYVASARVGGFVECVLRPWDFAAGKLIVEEAGGKVTDMQGNELSYEGPTSIIADNNLLHGVLLKCSEYKDE